MDILTIDSGRGDKGINILVITDHFSRYVQAIIASSQMAKATALALWQKFIVHYRIPEIIIIDQGRNFESELVQELCKLGQV